MAVLIAGGKSLRMGRDKCLLDWEGLPLWKRQLETLRAFEPDVLAVAAPECPAWLPGGVLWLPDAAVDAGPLGGILAALASVPSGRVIVLAVDLPLVPECYLRRLLSMSSAERGVVPLCADGYEPVAAVYPAIAAESAAAWLQSGRRDLQGWVRELEARDMIQALNVEKFEAGLFRNLNSPADLERDS